MLALRPLSVAFAAQTERRPLGGQWPSTLSWMSRGRYGEIGT